MFKKASIMLLILAAGTVLAGPPQPVSECGTVINAPGKYRLMNDLLDCTAPNQGVVIEAPDVTFDMRGHTISCDADATEELVGAVLVFDVSNVRIRNGSVFGCDDGILLWGTDGAQVTKMYMAGNIAGAITLVGAANSRLKKNRFEFNGTAIRSFVGEGNLYSHNTMHFDGTGIDLAFAETDSTVTCNIAEQTWFGIAVGSYSSGNVLRGNLAVDNFIGGMTFYGFGTPDAFDPVPAGNVIRHNIALGNAADDLQEIVYNPATDGVFVDPADTCQNTWMKNQFETATGPTDCIGTPVVLDEDDVCALDHDD